MAARLQSVPSCATDLTASVLVDGDRSFPLEVNCVAGTVSGMIPGLAPGKHTFELRFMLRGVLVAEAETSGDIASGQNTSIGFAPGALLFPDTDDDGWTNLAELTVGTDYQLASSVPESSVRRRSANYAIADVVGVVPVIGTAKSNGDRYVNSLGQGPFAR
jgi:hypothetical protein